MQIAGMQTLSLLDYPDRTAATIFTPSCNFACPFCHNGGLVAGNELERIDEKAVFDFLDTRVGLLDAICISGGEPTLQPGLSDFCSHVRAQGFLIKLDTNGSNPRVLADLLDKGLLDYVAIDIKNTAAKYALTTGTGDVAVEKVQKSISLLAHSTIAYEMRTTVVREFHQFDDLLELAEQLAHAPVWYLQNFKDAQTVLGGCGRFHPWESDELKACLPHLQRLCPNVRLREAG